MAPYSKFIAVVLLGMMLSSCTGNSIQSPNDTDGPFGLKIPSSFLFSTTKEVNLSISAKLPNGQPLAGAVYHVWDAHPAEGGKRLSSFFLDEGGVLNTVVTLPAYLTEVHLTSNFIGAQHHAVIPVQGNSILFNYSQPASQGSLNRLGIEPEPGFTPAGLMNSGPYTPIGTWNTQGRPDYLTVPDVLDVSFLNRINTILDGTNIPVNRPELLDSTIPTDLFLEADGQVWVTFLGNDPGATYFNTLGFYTYTAGNRPLTPDEIDTKYIIFPNATSGQDRLQPGDKVQLPGPGTDGIFPAGTYIGWFLVADGWRSTAEGGAITNRRHTNYGDPALNTHAPAGRERHLVVLYDVEESKLVLGWEDLVRTGTQPFRNDFNDVLFYASWNPPGAVNTAGVPTSGDPNAPERKIYNYGPAQDRLGTLLFEDLWPSYGDYDLNDLVVSYQTKETANINNNVEEIEITLVIRATGATISSGLGFMFDNVPPSNVASVTGSRLTSGNISTSANGTETDQQWATIIAFDDSNLNMPTFSNVYPHRAHVDYDTVTVTVTFANPVPKMILGSSPYNVFSFRTNERSHEIHLPGRRPSNLADTSKFGTRDDNSDPSAGRFYISNGNLNWALNVPDQIPYPHENASFLQAYKYFSDWAQSGGSTHANWYKDEGDNRNQSALYINPNAGGNEGDEED